MLSRVASRYYQVGSNFCWQPATFDNPVHSKKLVVNQNRNKQHGLKADILLRPADVTF